MSPHVRGRAGKHVRGRENGSWQTKSARLHEEETGAVVRKHEDEEAVKTVEAVPETGAYIMPMTAFTLTACAASRRPLRRSSKAMLRASAGLPAFT